MHSQETTLGTCPRCGSPIPRRRLLIEYERAGTRAAYAECPGCESVVRPRPD